MRKVACDAWFSMPDRAVVNERGVNFAETSGLVWDVSSIL